MRILGIDPGTRITGYGCVSLADGAIEPDLIEGGTLNFKSTESLEDRIRQLYDDVVELIDSLKPERLAIEKLYAHYKHPRTAIMMGHARGVIILAGKQAGLAIDNLPSTEVKKSITGYGHASKEQIQQAIAVQCRLDAPPSPPDVADAIAIAIVSARRVVTERLSAR